MNGKSMSFGSHKPLPTLHTHTHTHTHTTHTQTHTPSDQLQNADEIPPLKHVLWPVKVLLSLRTGILVT